MRKDMPKGFRDSQGKPKVAVVFEEEIFNKIKKMAVKEKRSFSAMVNELCKVGILDLEESDQYEVVQVAQVAKETVE